MPPSPSLPPRPPAAGLGRPAGPPGAPPPARATRPRPARPSARPPVRPPGRRYASARARAARPASCPPRCASPSATPMPAPASPRVEIFWKASGRPRVRTSTNYHPNLPTPAQRRTARTQLTHPWHVWNALVLQIIGSLCKQISENFSTCFKNSGSRHP